MVRQSRYSRASAHAAPDAFVRALGVCDRTRLRFVPDTLRRSSTDGTPSAQSYAPLPQSLAEARGVPASPDSIRQRLNQIAPPTALLAGMLDWPDCAPSSSVTATPCR